jgi:hypothetical protein
MSNLTVNYTGESVPTQGLVTTPLQASTQILQGYIPANLKDLSTNTHFRDVTIGYILRDAVDQDTALKALCTGLRGAADAVSIRTMTEYVTAVAYSWGHPNVVVEAIARNKPEEASSFIWSVAQAMTKQMPGPFYQTLLISQLPQAESSWLAEA